LTQINIRPALRAQAKNSTNPHFTEMPAIYGENALFDPCGGDVPFVVEIRGTDAAV
jgi:hypothetical protein